jgi:DNA polymerase
MQKATVIDALADEQCPEIVKKVLRIRQAYGRSSITKYKAFIDRADPDDWMIRDHQRYHGARTGRVAGQGIQTQNFPRPDPGIKFEQVKRAIQAVKLRDSEFFAGLFDNPAAMLSAAIRPTICASPGRTFYCIDYSSIEAVLTLWFCDDPGLQLIRDGLCVYKELAGQIYNLEDPQSLDKKSDMRQSGKVGVLSCGYGIGAKKLKLTAKVQWGLDLSLDFCKIVVKAYRDKFAKVPEMWRKLQQAMLACVWNKEDVDVHRGVGFEWRPPFVTLRLMSGRRIYYHKPEIRIEMAPWGSETPCLYYWGENSQTKRWELQKTYGGKELDHVIQGAARDLMCDAALQVDADPDLGDLIMTVHDELVYEVDDDMNPKEACEKTCKIMTTVPDWAGDCPVSVEAWVGKEYRK